MAIPSEKNLVKTILLEIKEEAKIVDGEAGSYAGLLQVLEAPVTMRGSFGTMKLLHLEIAPQQIIHQEYASNGRQREQSQT